MRASRFSNLFLGGLVLGLMGWTLCPPSEAWVEEHYSRGLYRSVARVLVPLVDSVPFSASGLSLLLLGLGLSAAAFCSWRRLRRQGVPRWKAGARLGRGLLLTFALGYVMFLVFWGAGYHRERLQDRLGLQVSQVKPADVYRWVSGLAQVIGQSNRPRGERAENLALDSLRDSLMEVAAE